MREGLLILAAVALLLASSTTHAVSQEALGFSRSDTPSPPVKLQGFAFQKTKGGYIVISVPPKDVMRVIEVAKMLEPHEAFLDALVKLDVVSKRVAPATVPAVPLGACLLETNEVFSEKHKILDREVRLVGIFSFLTRDGRAHRMAVYFGGPT